MPLENNQELFTEAIGDYRPEELNPMSQTSMDVTRKIFAIRRIQKDIDQYAQNSLESQQFYQKKIDNLEKQIAYLEGDVWAYLNREGLDNIATPGGTASVVHRDKWTWANDTQVLSYAKENVPHLVTQVTEDKVNKNELKKYFKENQSVPPEVAVVTEEASINIRINP